MRLVASRLVSRVGFDTGRAGYGATVTRPSIPSPFRALAGIHAAYLIVSGLWAVVQRSSFERVTGAKRDYWLVRLVGALAAVVGATLGTAVARNNRSREARTLAVGSAVVFGAADLYAARRYSRVYLGDVVAQSLFVPAWLVDWSHAPERSEAQRAVAPAEPRPTDDEEVAALVREAAALAELDVEVNEGIVTLRGVVKSQELGDELAARIAQVRGVRGVDPHLQVG